MTNGLLPRSEFYNVTPPEIMLKFKNDDYAFLRDYFEYNPKTGEIIRIKSFHSNRVGKNTIVGAPNGKDNDVVFIKRKFFSAWKVIYYLQKGVYLSNSYCCHFIDGDKHNHKAENLSIISRSDKIHLINNFPNCGIFQTGKNKKYAVKIKRGGQGDTYLGWFDDEKTARVTYMKAKLDIRNNIHSRGVL